jgi:alkanesulfonate monooxygenase
MTIQPPPLRLFWFLPTAGDGPDLGSPAGWRPATFDYMQTLAQAVDRLGFEGVRLPTGPTCLDGWTLASALAPPTRLLTFLIALRRAGGKGGQSIYREATPVYRFSISGVNGLEAGAPTGERSR